MLSSPRSEHRDECGKQHACTLCYGTCKVIENNVLEDRKSYIVNYKFYIQIQYTWYDSVIDCSVLHTKRVLKVLRKDDVSIDKIAECVVYQKAVPCSSAVGRTNDSHSNNGLNRLEKSWKCRNRENLLMRRTQRNISFQHTNHQKKEERKQRHKKGRITSGSNNITQRLINQIIYNYQFFQPCHKIGKV